MQRHGQLILFLRNCTVAVFLPAPGIEIAGLYLLPGRDDLLRTRFHIRGVDHHLFLLVSFLFIRLHEIEFRTYTFHFSSGNYRSKACKRQPAASNHHRWVCLSDGGCSLSQDLSGSPF
jgi:hypothetical protein